VTAFTSSAAPLPPGTELAGYRIDALAGEGGMGVVYRARQLTLQRVVALKVIAAGLARDADQRARFTDEALLAAAIDHPNVVPVHEAGEADGVLFIAMRFVEGTDLRALVEAQGALAPERAVAIVEQVANALDAAHRRGLIHRDVKPGNVLLDEDEHAYLTDFGLSKLTAGGHGHTRTGMFVGTPDFMAPEQIRGEPADARSDVYALACVLVFALAASPPFPRDSETAVFYAHIEQPPPKPSELAAGVPAALDAVVAKAMDKDPTMRYSTCAELAADARAALGGGSVAAPAPSVPVERQRSTFQKVVAGPAGGPRGRRIALLATLGTLLAGGLAATGLVAAGVVGGGDDDSAETPTKAAAPAKAAPDAASPSIRATIKVGRGPDGITVADGNVFVANRLEGTLSRIDRVNNREFPNRLELGIKPNSVAAGKGVVWIADAGSDLLQRVEGKDATPTATVRIGRDAQSVSLGVQNVWVANTADDTVTRVDRATPAVVGTPIGVGRQPANIAVGQSVWVSNFGDDTVTRIDRSTAQIVGGPIPVGDGPLGIVEADGAVWVANSDADTVTRIDARTGKVVAKAIRVGRNPRQLAVGHGFVWVTNHDDNSVSRIDPKTNRVVGGALPVGRRPLGVAVGPDSVWVTNFADDTISRIRPG
jgi:YVTN family beta-propeller protein